MPESFSFVALGLIAKYGMNVYRILAIGYFALWQAIWLPGEDRNARSDRADLGHGIEKSEEKPATRIPPDISKVRYGASVSQVLSVWKARSRSGSAPALIYFHGGGFMWGTDENIPEDIVATCLQEGVVVVSADYRKLGEPDNAKYPAMIEDAAKVVQTVSHRSSEWGIDPARIALAGWSAGANMALWVAFHDDLARPDS